MKRRFTAVLCVIAIFLALCACAAEKEDAEGAVSVYFPVKSEPGADISPDESIIDCEYRVTQEKNIFSAMEMLLWGPVDKDRFSGIFPQNMSVLEIKQEDDAAIVTLSGEYEKLEGVEMSIANACITETLTQFEGIDRVVISYTGTDGSTHAEAYSGDSFELMSQRRESEEYAVTIYYGSGDGKSLLSYSENLVAAEPEKVERFILDAVIEGAKGGKYPSSVPEGTRVLGIYTDNRICYVNLSIDFLTGAPEDELTQLAAVYAVIDSLTAMDEVDSVQILVEGKICEYYGKVPISEPIVRDESLIFKRGNYLNTQLYLRRENAAYVSPRFWQIEKTEYATDEQLIVQTLLNMRIPQGYEQLFPEGTRLQTIATRDGVCYVNLTEELLQAETRQIIYAAYSLTASLVQLEGIEEVELMCGGRRVELDGFELPLRLNEDNVMIG